MKRNYKHYLTATLIGAVLLLLMGCSGERGPRVVQAPAMTVQPVVGLTGEVIGSNINGIYAANDDIAMQMALMAQGLPTEPWYTKILPDLFGVNEEEVRTGLMMYAVQVQAWRETVVKVELPSYTLPDGSTVGGGGFRFAPYPVPAPPEFMSGLQRLGVNGMQILTGFLGYLALDGAKHAASQNAQAGRDAGNAAAAGFNAGANSTLNGVNAGAAIAAP